MEVKIQISDSVYAQLLNGTGRIRGTIGLVSPTEGNFSEHRMNLRIARDERIDAPQAILGESIDASNFVEIIADESFD